MADPAFRGFVESTLDALLVFEGCSRGALPKITRRLQEFEKRALVVSGAVFVFDEEETGIKRWTDGLTWSPSRTLGNFLVYRELDKKAGGPGGMGEGDEMAPIAGTSNSTGMEPFDDTPLDNPPPTAASSSSQRRRSLSDTSATSPPLDRARERALVGSLTSTYRFRSDGLVKKTISLAGLHMIGYYKIDDVTSGRLRTPSSHQELTAFEVSSNFLAPSLFRVPPLVEVGVDGQLRYKGEPETPVSPSLARSGSSQSFSSPAIGGTIRSRPPSSDSQSQRPLSPRLPPLTASTSHNTPGSPHRANTATLRNTDRYNPYSVPGRSSPNLNMSTYNSQSYFQVGPPGSPNRSAYAQDELYRATSADAQQTAGLSPSLSMLSSSAPPPQTWGMTPQGMGRNDQPPPMRSFYQPRHATPFSPDDQGLSSSGPSTSGIFAYQAPPTGGRLSRPSSATSPPPPLYQHYASSPHSLPPPPQHHAPPPPQFPTLPSQQHQQQSQYGGGGYSRPYSQSGPPPSSGGYSSASSRRSPVQSMQNHPPPQHHHQQQAASEYDYSVLSQPSYPTYSMSSTPSYPSYDSRGLPSGLVMGVGSGEPSDDEERHGLGLGADPTQQGGSNGHDGRVQTSDLLRSVKREPHDQPPSWWQQGGQHGGWQANE